MNRPKTQKALMDLIQGLITDGKIHRSVAVSVLKSIGSGINKTSISWVNFHLFIEKMDYEMDITINLTTEGGDTSSINLKDL